jgi:Family of unknown function (DUF6220)
MRKAFAGLASLLMLAAVAQFFLAASGAFDTAPNDESFQPHRALGYGIVLLAVLLTAFAALVRVPGRIIGLSGLVAGLALLQPMIAAIANALGDSGDTSNAGQLVFGLHGINGLIIIAVVGTIVRGAREAGGSAPLSARAGAIGAEAGGPAADPIQPAR